MTDILHPLYSSFQEVRQPHLAMASPSLKDLPHVSPTVKSELEGFSADKLKHTETVEKVVLPTKEGESVSGAGGAISMVGGNVEVEVR